MEKYIIFLILIAIFLFALCTFPVLGNSAENIYVVCPDATYAQCILEDSPDWKTHDYFVFLISKENAAKAKTVPHGKTVYEYSRQNGHTIDMCNPFLQAITANGVTTFGLPYIIIN